MMSRHRVLSTAICVQNEIDTSCRGAVTMDKLSYVDQMRFITSVTFSIETESESD